MPSSEHPSLEQLDAYLLGKLDDEESTAIESHLETCEDCYQHLEALENDEKNDALLHQLRDAHQNPTATVASEKQTHIQEDNPDQTIARDPEPFVKLAPEVPGYEILGELGRGGMGAVYKARDLRLKRLVALKVILSGPFSTPHEHRRFRQEAEAIARLQHPHIVQLYEVGEHHGFPHLVLELVEGGPLDRHLTKLPQPPRWSAWLIERLARAIHFAHQQGVVHRDLKPANILMTADNASDGQAEPTPPRLRLPPAAAPKISDFGLAKNLDSQSLETRTGSVLGTPSYMAPEQAMGRVRETGPQADLYSLGAIFYELLTGRPPFMAESVQELLMMVEKEEPVPPLRLQPNLPHDLQTICLKCLEKEPARRYASGEELAEDLRRFLDNQPILAKPAGMLRKGVLFYRRNQTACLLTMTFLLVSVCSVGFYIKSLQAAYKTIAEERNAAVEARWEAHRQEQIARKEERGAKAQALAMESVFVRESDPPLSLLLAREAVMLSQREKLEIPSGAYEALLAAVASVRGKTVLKESAPIAALATHNASGRLATCDANGVIRIWKPDENQDLRLERTWELNTRPRALAFDADCQSLWAAGIQRLRRFSFTEETPNTTLQTEAPLQQAAFSPDGRWLAGIYRDRWERRPILWSLANSSFQPAKIAEGASSEIAHAVAFTADSRFLAIGQTEHLLFQPLDGRPAPPRRCPTPQGKPVCLAFSRTGSMAVGSENNTVSAWSNIRPLLSGRQTSLPAPEIVLPHTAQVAEMHFHPHLPLLLANARGRSIQLWRLNAAVKGKTNRLLGHAAVVNAMAWNKQGQLFSADRAGMVRRWEINRESQTNPHRVQNRRGDIAQSLFLPDGRLVWGGESRLLIGHPHARNAGEALWELPLPAEARGRRIQIQFAVDAQGARLAASRASNKIYLWELSPQGPSERREWINGQQQVRRLAMEPSGRYLAAADFYGEIRLWDLSQEPPALVKTWSDGEDFRATALAFQPRGDLLAGGGVRGEIRLWEWKSKEAKPPSRSLDGHEAAIQSLAFDGEGGRLASTSLDGFARVWSVGDLQSEQEPLVLQGHAGGVFCAAFSPGGGRLLTGGADEDLRIWSLNAKDPSALPVVLRGGLSPSISVAFSPDGGRVASARENGRIWVWDLRLETLLEEALEKAGRELTQAERKTRGL